MKYRVIQRTDGKYYVQRDRGKGWETKGTQIDCWWTAAEPYWHQSYTEDKANLVLDGILGIDTVSVVREEGDIKVPIALDLQQALFVVAVILIIGYALGAWLG